MELIQIIKVIGAHKRALAAVFLVAVLAAVLTSMGRSSSFGSAQTQILVDSPQSALANLKQDTVPLSTRAGVFAQFMASSAAIDAVSDVTGIPASKIVARGPFDDPAAAPTSGDAAPRPAPPESSAGGRDYRLTFVAQEELPLVTVYAEAPTEQQAKVLADGVPKGVADHVARLQAEGELPAKQRVVIRGLGPAQAGTVTDGPGPGLVFLAFLLVLAAGCAAILVLARFTRSEAGPVASNGHGSGDGIEMLDSLHGFEGLKQRGSRSRRGRRKSTTPSG